METRLIFYLIITDGTMRSNQLGVRLLSYEMNRGYFADTKEFKEHGGKITAANKTVIHAVSAVKFPELAVTLSSGKVLKLPVTSGSSEVNAESLVVPKEMISSWSKPFLESQFLILRQLTSAHVEQGDEKLSVQRAMLMESRCFTRKIR
ncbi:hypothetical protein HID58_080211 [Brassica napus]|uniref:Uncharacterized protein n=2 Tax=Brassica TaxID=3705 RepID=A0ABQ7Y484_BRANA|nr:hypothetical protein HID58_080211 [Brassica napus]